MITVCRLKLLPIINIFIGSLDFIFYWINVVVILNLDVFKRLFN